MATVRADGKRLTPQYLRHMLVQLRGDIPGLSCACLEKDRTLNDGYVIPVWAGKSPATLAYPGGMGGRSLKECAAWIQGVHDAAVPGLLPRRKA